MNLVQISRSSDSKVLGEIDGITTFVSFC